METMSSLSQEMISSGTTQVTFDGSEFHMSFLESSSPPSLPSKKSMFSRNGGEGLFESIIFSPDSIKKEEIEIHEHDLMDEHTSLEGHSYSGVDPQTISRTPPSPITATSPHCAPVSPMDSPHKSHTKIPIIIKSGETLHIKNKH